MRPLEHFLVYKRIDGEFWTYGWATSKSLPAVVECCARAYPGEPIMVERDDDRQRVVLDAAGMHRVATLIARDRLTPSPLDRAPETSAR
jgi:hypothetical protein